MLSGYDKGLPVAGAGGVGASAFQDWLTLPGNAGKTKEQFLASLVQAGAVSPSDLDLALAPIEAALSGKANTANPVFTGSVREQEAGAYFTDLGGVPASIHRGPDRSLNGLAADWDGGKTSTLPGWLATVGRGIYGYLLRCAGMAHVSRYGTIAAFFATRSSDLAGMPGAPGYGIPAALAKMAVNDATGPNAIEVWGDYTTVVRMPGAKTTHVSEGDALNATTDRIVATCYGGAPAGSTIGHVVNAGGEGADYNAPSTGGQTPFPNTSPSTLAFGVGGNGQTWFHAFTAFAASISPLADGSTGMINGPANYHIRHEFDATGQTGGFWTCNVSNVAKQIGVVLSDYGLFVQNLAGALFCQIEGAGPNTANRPYMAAALAGGAVTYGVQGSDADIGITIAPKNAGIVNVQGSATVAYGFTVGGVATFAQPIRPPSYTVGTLPTPGTARQTAYCVNARVLTAGGTLQAAGAGTGGLVSDDSTAWRIAGTNIQAQA